MLRIVLLCPTVNGERCQWAVPDACDVLRPAAVVAGVGEAGRHDHQVAGAREQEVLVT